MSSSSKKSLLVRVSAMLAVFACVGGLVSIVRSRLVEGMDLQAIENRWTTNTAAVSQRHFSTPATEEFSAFRSNLEIESAKLNGHTIVVNYFIPESGTPVFEMFDVLGQRLTVQNAGFQIPGTHTVELPAPDRKRGTCFVQLRIGEKKSVKRAMVL